MINLKHEIKSLGVEYGFYPYGLDVDSFEIPFNTEKCKEVFLTTVKFVSEDFKIKTSLTKPHRIDFASGTIITVYDDPDLLEETLTKVDLDITFSYNLDICVKCYTITVVKGNVDVKVNYPNIIKPLNMMKVSPLVLSYVCTTPYQYRKFLKRHSYDKLK